MISTVFDTETTGVNAKEDPSDPKTAKVVQFFAAMFEHDPQQDYFEIDHKGIKRLTLKPIQTLNTIVYLEDGLTVDPRAEAVHGISAERSRTLGAALDGVASVFADWADASDMLVAHNIAFDRKIMRRMFHEAQIDPAIIDKPTHFCTMNYLKPIMQMTPRMFGDWKMPKLIEAYQYLFLRDFDGDAHDAAADSMACADIYFEIGHLEKLKLQQG